MALGPQLAVLSSEAEAMSQRRLLGWALIILSAIAGVIIEFLGGGLFDFHRYDTSVGPNISGGVFVVSWVLHFKLPALIPFLLGLVGILCLCARRPKQPNR